MTSYRYLGYGRTDANGVAHLKKNASGQDVDGYVGTGAGEVDVIASLDNPISQGSIVSKTLSVLDCTFYDNGTDNPKTKTWYNQDTAFTLTPSTNGTLVETSSTSGKKLFADGTGWGNSFKWTAPVCVEVYIISSTGNDNQLYIGGNVSPSISFNGECNLKMVWDGSKVYKYVNGTQTGTTNNVTSETIAIGFNSSNGSFTFKDFRIYPI